LVVQDKENEIRKALSETVDNDEQLKDVSEALNEAAKAVEDITTKEITRRLEKLDKKKGYSIMKSLSSIKQPQEQ
jgi:hypothetical protein